MPDKGYGVWWDFEGAYDPCWFMDAGGVIFCTDNLGYARAMAIAHGGEVQRMGPKGQPLSIAEETDNTRQARHELTRMDEQAGQSLYGRLHNV